MFSRGRSRTSHVQGELLDLRVFFRLVLGMFRDALSKDSETLERVLCGGSGIEHF